MILGIKRKDILKRHIAIPQDHGSWVFLFSPLLIGIFAGNNFSVGTLFLVIAALMGFLIRQPISTIVKIYSSRRSKRDLMAAIFWTSVYAVIGALALVGLVLQGFGFILVLAIPGVPVFAWHLWLISRRSERKQMGVEIVASGVLAFTAPAAYWVALGHPDPTGWLLFMLVWLQSAASIVYAYLRLEQRSLTRLLKFNERFKMAHRALLYSTFNLVFVFTLMLSDYVPTLLPIPYIFQWVECIYGTLKPAIGVKPTRIGIRQLVVSTIFTILFIITWNFPA